ncbi:MAG: tRNA pseudouridine(38-40) synthase TruA [Alphaproteobacteria bacterium]|nr:tRNA pseudouridine(38-40) synthase TruA [Alphaproteobacteria bacterium]
MTRYKLLIEYDGSGLVGWQRQDNGPSVQQAMEEAIQQFAGHPVALFVAGRTDAGVHALGQVAHVDLERDWPPATVRDATNFHLRPAAISVLAAEIAPPDFHARFSASGRRYLYRIVNRPAPLAVERRRAWHIVQPLDAAAMQAAAARLLGRHDFTSFRAALCQAASPVKTLDRLDVTRAGDAIEFAVAARSFLHHQVRNMVGTLKLVGEGKWTPDDVARALAARDRAAAGPTAPADGLYLVEVRYDASQDDAGSGQGLHQPGDDEIE